MCMCMCMIIRSPSQLRASSGYIHWLAHCVLIVCWRRWGGRQHRWGSREHWVVHQQQPDQLTLDVGTAAGGLIKVGRVGRARLPPARHQQPVPACKPRAGVLAVGGHFASLLPSSAQEPIATLHTTTHPAVLRHADPCAGQTSAVARSSRDRRELVASSRRSCQRIVDPFSWPRPDPNTGKADTSEWRGCDLGEATLLTRCSESRVLHVSYPSLATGRAI